MKTILTNEDVKNIVEKAFDENSEKIVLVQEDSNERNISMNWRFFGRYVCSFGDSWGDFFECNNC